MSVPLLSNNFKGLTDFNITNQLKFSGASNSLDGGRKKDRAALNLELCSSNVCKDGLINPNPFLSFLSL